eukprot:scaffold7444_cov149-Skeletonema_menzelii.AAC.7
MEDEHVASSTTAPVETADGDGGTKCFICKKRLGRKTVWMATRQIAALDLMAPLISHCVAAQYAFVSPTD